MLPVALTRAPTAASSALTAAGLDDTSAAANLWLGLSVAALTIVEAIPRRR